MKVFCVNKTTEAVKQVTCKAGTDGQNTVKFYNAWVGQPWYHQRPKSLSTTALTAANVIEL